jgi:hypothetical protein
MPQEYYAQQDSQKREEGATNEEYRQMQDGKTGEINYKHFNSSNVRKGFNFQTGQRCQHW